MSANLIPFTTDGGIITSGDIIVGGLPASPAPSISGFSSVSASSVSALTFTNGNSNVNVTANTNTWTFDDTGNLSLPGNINITGNIIPSYNITYDLGTSANRFKDIWLSGSTIYLGEQTISATDAENVIVFNNNISAVNVSASGNIATTGNVIAGNITSTGELSITGNAIVGNLNTSGQIITTRAGNSSDGGGQLYLNGEDNNRIDFNLNGYNAPSLTTRSTGTKITLRPGLSDTTVDFAIGMSGDALWHSIPLEYDEQYFKWYAGTTEIASLNGLGTFSVSGNISATGKVIAGNLTSTGLTDLGSISNVTITGGTSGQVLTTNGSNVLSWATASGGGSNISNGTSNVDIATADGNVTVTSNANTWTFGSDGNLTLPDTTSVIYNGYPGVGVIPNAVSVVSEQAWLANPAGNLWVGFDQGSGIQMGTHDGATQYIWSFDNTGNIVLPTNSFNVNYANGDPVPLGDGTGSNISNGTSTVSIPEVDGNVTIATNNEHAWIFDTTGNLAVPGAIITSSYSKLDLVTGGANTAYLTTTLDNTTALFMTDQLLTLYAAGNVTIGSAGNTTLTVTDTGADVTGTLSTTGNLTTNGQIVTTGPANSTTGGGQLYISGADTSRIDFNLVGGGAPEFFTRSNGTKITLFPTLSDTTVDFALGIESGALWSSIPIADNSNYFKWYGGTTELASLSGTGEFSVSGNISAGNLTITDSGTFGNISTSGSEGNISGANVITANTFVALTNFTVTGITNLGSVSNVNIIGGSNGQYLQTDGSGVLTWATASGISNGTSNVDIAVADGNVIINSAGNTTLTVTDTGANITGTLSTSGNVTGANLSVTGNTTITYVPATSVGYGITINAADTQGGTGYADFLKVTNTSSGATNPNKSLRVNSTGAFEILNSEYTATLLGLNDSGNLNIAGQYQVSGKTAVNGPAFSAYANTTLQTITSSSQQKVLFQTEEFDTNNNYDNSRFTPSVEGYYQLNAEVRLDGASGTGEIMIVLYKNGAEYKRGTNQSGTQIASSFWAMTVNSLAYANGTGDYFEIYVQQTSGSSVTVTAVSNPAITWFNGCMVRGG